MNILIAEDDIIVRNALEFNLKKENHTVTTAADGREALTKMEEKIPDIVITDLMMPYVSGLELVKFIKNKYHNNVKVIVSTSIGQEDAIMECFTLGADDFITKPFIPEDLKARIQRFSF